MTFQEATRKARKLAREKNWKVVYYVYTDPDSPDSRRLRVGDGYALDEGAIEDRDIVASSHD